MALHRSYADEWPTLYPYKQDQFSEIFDDPRNRQKLSNRHDKHSLYTRPLRDVPCLI